MENIELTKEHKSKLLEMCKVLFPEYVNIQFQQIDFLQFSGKHNFHIHWFEFCMTYLPEKIFKNPKGRFQGINGRPYWCEKVAESFAKVHPIDYLYEEFKKLK